MIHGMPWEQFLERERVKGYDGLHQMMKKPRARIQREDIISRERCKFSRKGSKKKSNPSLIPSSKRLQLQEWNEIVMKDARKDSTNFKPSHAGNLIECL